MKRLFFRNFLILGGINSILILTLIYVILPLKLFLLTELALVFILGLLLFYSLRFILKVKLLRSTLNTITFFFFLGLCYALIPQTYLALPKPTIVINNLNKIPAGNYYLKTPSISLNRNIIGHSYKFESVSRSEFNRYNHYFAIPIVTNSHSDKYNNWLIIHKKQRINKTWNNDMAKKKLAFFTTYHLDSVKKMETKDINFYEISQHVTNDNNKNLMLRSVIQTNKNTDSLTLFRPHYIDIPAYKKQQKNMFTWAVLASFIFIALVSLINSVNRS